MGGDSYGKGKVDMPGIVKGEVLIKGVKEFS